MDLNGVAAIVTGGASGLGNATVAMLAARGAKVSIFDLNEEVGTAAAAELGGAFFKVNVADDASVAEALEAAEVLHGAGAGELRGAAPAVRIVNKEGIAHSLDVYRKTIEVNLLNIIATSCCIHCDSLNKFLTG